MQPKSANLTLQAGCKFLPCPCPAKFALKLQESAGAKSKLMNIFYNNLSQAAVWLRPYACAKTVFAKGAPANRRFIW